MEKSSGVVIIKIDVLSLFLTACPGIILLPQMFKSGLF